MRSIRRGLLLALVVIAIVAASAAVSIARTPSEQSVIAAAAAATPAVPDRFARSVGGAFTAVPDEAAMVLIGAALFGVAAAVKRAA